MKRHDYIRKRLAQLQRQKHIRNYEVQSGMPGKRWTIEPYVYGGQTSFTTPQIELWLDGVATILATIDR